jgi:ferredoxin--NADP+ reductase
VAVVGSGPAGFYAAEALFKSGKNVQVDVFERLPCPYGLVRAGVAPDHQKLKSVIRIYEKISDHERFAFLGNVTVGKDVSVEELRSFYDAVLVACGTETDRRLGIPGEDLRGSHTATEFVGWYNGHPDYRDRTFDLSGKVAVVIGQGNVAMDVSRILAKTPDELRDSDIAEHALEALSRSRVREIHVIGRRGPVQAKFTPPEIKEIGELADCDPVLDPSDFVHNPASRAELDDPGNTHVRRNVAIMQEYAARAASGTSRRYVMRFFLGPVEIRGGDRVRDLVLERNRLEGEPGNQKARGTGVTETLGCGLVFRSVGYHGRPTPGVPFDDRQGVIPNVKGRVIDRNEPVPGLYVSGWIKRGPTGVIGTNKPDSVETVASLLADLPRLAPCPRPDSGALHDLLASRHVRVVSYEDWRRIDAREVERGQARGKPREKFATVAEMLALLE